MAIASNLSSLYYGGWQFTVERNPSVTVYVNSPDNLIRMPIYSSLSHNNQTSYSFSDDMLSNSMMIAYNKRVVRESNISTIDQLYNDAKKGFENTLEEIRNGTLKRTTIETYEEIFKWLSKLRSPDYYAFETTVEIPLTDFSLSIGSYVLDRNWNIYRITTLSAGKGSRIPFSGNVTVGYMMTSEIPAPDHLEEFLTGKYTCITLGYMAGVQMIETFDSLGNELYGVEIGAMTPTASAMIGYSQHIGKVEKEKILRYLPWINNNKSNNSYGSGVLLV